jgi:AcrR family transcriptional regulator
MWLNPVVIVMATTFVGSVFERFERYSKEMADTVKRPYDASSRQAQAQRSRRHIVESARRLFIEQGYAATSMRELASAAGVSLQTLYNAFTSKYGLFSAVMDVVVAGDHEPVPISDRPALRSIEEIDDPAGVIDAAVAAAVPVLSRVDEIFPVLRAAAAADPEIGAGYQHFVIEARHADQRLLGERLQQLGALRPGIDSDRATDIAWTVLSPDCFHLLVGLRRWSEDDFGEWARQSLEATLLAPDGGASRR